MGHEVRLIWVWRISDSFTQGVAFDWTLKFSWPFYTRIDRSHLKLKDNVREGVHCWVVLWRSWRWLNDSLKNEWICNISHLMLAWVGIIVVHTVILLFWFYRRINGGLWERERDWLRTWVLDLSAWQWPEQDSASAPYYHVALSSSLWQAGTWML